MLRFMCSFKLDYCAYILLGFFFFFFFFYVFACIYFINCTCFKLSILVSGLVYFSLILHEFILQDY